MRVVRALPAPMERVLGWRLLRALSSSSPFYAAKRSPLFWKNLYEDS